MSLSNEVGTCDLVKDKVLFVMFSTPLAGADSFCRLLNRHPEVSCGGDLFGPHSTIGADERRRVGLSFDAARADPVKLLRGHLSHCTKVPHHRTLHAHLAHGHCIAMQNLCH